jgi:hypothetical protein
LKSLLGLIHRFSGQRLNIELLISRVLQKTGFSLCYSCRGFLFHMTSFNNAFCECLFLWNILPISGIPENDFCSEHGSFANEVPNRSRGLWLS